jgi:hypothetical protein
LRLDDGVSGYLVFNAVRSPISRKSRRIDPEKQTPRKLLSVRASLVPLAHAAIWSPFSVAIRHPLSPLTACA